MCVCMLSILASSMSHINYNWMSVEVTKPLKCRRIKIIITLSDILYKIEKSEVSCKKSHSALLFQIYWHNMDTACNVCLCR